MALHDELIPDETDLGGETVFDGWTALWQALDLVLPLLVLALAVTAVLAVVNAAVTAASDHAADEDSVFVVIISTLVFSIMGVIFGMLLQLVGGFQVLAQDAGGNFVTGLSAMVLAFLGVTGSLLSEAGFLRSGKLDKPLASLAFLVCFVVSGFYWRFLEAQI